MAAPVAAGATTHPAAHLKRQAHTRLAVPIAWTAAILSVLCGIGDTVITAASRPLDSEKTIAVHGWPLVTSATIGAAVMGALILSRYPRHPVGWLLCMVGFTASISMVTEAYALWVTEDGGPGPQALANAAGWLSGVFGGAMSLTGLIWVFLLVPDGHWLSPRWRYVGWTAVAGMVLIWTGLATIKPTTYDVSAPDNAGRAGVILSIGFIAIALMLPAAVACLVVRLRRSVGRERQQLRLIAFAAALVALGLITMFVVVELNGGDQTWAAAVPLFAAYFVMPFLFAIAVLRYRLYEVEVVVNRAVLLAIATALAALGYVLMVVSVSRFVGDQTDSYLVSFVALVVVSLWFQSLRQGVVSLANRLAFGARAAPYEALSSFNRRLGETPAIERLLPTVAEAAGTSVAASRVRVALWVHGATAAEAVWPAEAERTATDHRVPVRAAGEVLGVIEVSLPRGRTMRASDDRMLRDLADHAAPAFRNAALQLRLADQVEELRHSTEQLEASRRRLVEADDVERRRIETEIAQRVLPPLHDLPNMLAAANATGPTKVAVEVLVDTTNQALEALRDVTRGVFPTQLARLGLSSALTSLLAQASAPVELTVAPELRELRFSPRVESAVYFCCAEVVRGLQGPASICVALTPQCLLLTVDGLGQGPSTSQELLDRVESVGGTLTIGLGSVEVQVPATPVPVEATLPTLVT